MIEIAKDHLQVGFRTIPKAEQSGGKGPVYRALTDLTASGIHCVAFITDTYNEIQTLGCYPCDLHHYHRCILPDLLASAYITYCWYETGRQDSPRYSAQGKDSQAHIPSVSALQQTTSQSPPSSTIETDSPIPQSAINLGPIAVRNHKQRPHIPLASNMTDNKRTHAQVYSAQSYSPHPHGP